MLFGAETVANDSSRSTGPDHRNGSRLGHGYICLRSSDESTCGPCVRTFHKKNRWMTSADLLQTGYGAQRLFRVPGKTKCLFLNKADFSYEEHFSRSLE